MKLDFDGSMEEFQALFIQPQVDIMKIALEVSEGGKKSSTTPLGGNSSSEVDLTSTTTNGNLVIQLPPQKQRKPRTPSRKTKMDLWRLLHQQMESGQDLVLAELTYQLYGTLAGHTNTVRSWVEEWLTNPKIRSAYKIGDIWKTDRGGKERYLKGWRYTGKLTEGWQDSLHPEMLEALTAP